MKPRKNQTIKEMKNNTNYVFLGQHSIDVWPGWATRYVYQHIEGTMWAKDYSMSDDDGHEGNDWFEVKPVVTTRYEKVNG